MTSHITLDAQQATINQFLIFLYSDVLQYPEPNAVATMPKIEIENRENQKFPDELELYCLAQQFNLPQLEHKAIKTIQSQVAKKAGKYLLRAHVQSQEGYKVGNSFGKQSILRPSMVSNSSFETNPPPL